MGRNIRCYRRVWFLGEKEKGKFLHRSLVCSVSSHLCTMLTVILSRMAFWVVIFEELERGVIGGLIAWP